MNTITPHIKESQKRQFATISIFLRRYSVVVAYYLNKLHITPQQVLFSRVIFFWWGSLPFLFAENYVYNLIWLVFLILCYFFDLVDGDLARNHDQVTKMWGFLDENFDSIVLNSIILTFTLKFLNHGYESIFVYAGIFLLFATIFSTRMTLLFQSRFNINCWQWGDTIENYLKNNTLDVMSTILYRLMTPKGFPFSIFSNFRDYLLIGLLFHIMPWSLLIFSLMLNIRWIILFIMVAMYYNGIDTNTSKLKIFSLLKQSEI